MAGQYECTARVLSQGAKVKVTVLVPNQELPAGAFLRRFRNSNADLGLNVQDWEVLPSIKVANIYQTLAILNIDEASWQLIASQDYKIRFRSRFVRFERHGQRRGAENNRTRVVGFPRENQ